MKYLIFFASLSIANAAVISMSLFGGNYGDPHYTTLDGNSYTFNGYGEYTYLAISDERVKQRSANFNPNQSYKFMSQIRTIPLQNTTTSASKVTVTSGFAARSNVADAQPISVTVSRHKSLVICRGNEILKFISASSNSNNVTLVFHDVIIEKNLTNEITTLSWPIGVIIQITPVKITKPILGIVLNVIVSLSKIYKGQTYGLMGNYDDNATNDLQNSKGEFIKPSDTVEHIHKRFGITWSIDPLKSLFYYEAGTESATFYHEQNQIFQPMFNDPRPIRRQLDTAIFDACHISTNASGNLSSWSVAQRMCYYDISVTNDFQFGQSSLAAGEELRQKQQHSASNRFEPIIYMMAIILGRLFI
ncbi:unnamed protein product [Didymodactylos carnosus]|uniref:VWFD domain-containing protein n=1 Tax=Didymodactylos carnosus TaxID=1234261 RepID=A0A815VJH2_9BILA|nr:unnamed protein product [Didymodactylos carnosus]CAF4388849.1 unnamed protein product [Didymodactylos carnosus]